MTNQPIRVVLYGHEECCLCHEAEAMLDNVLREASDECSFELTKVDIRTDQRYASLCCQVPVVTFEGGNRVALRITPERLRRALNHALQRRHPTSQMQK